MMPRAGTPPLFALALACCSGSADGIGAAEGGGNGLDGGVDGADGGDDRADGGGDDADGGDDRADGGGDDADDGAATDCVAAAAAIVLSDSDDGLELVSAPDSVALDVGAPANLAVRVDGYRRPIEVTAAIPIHTWVGGVTAPSPGDESELLVTTLEEAEAVIGLSTLRMYDHDLVVRLRPEGEERAVDVSIGIDVTVPPRAALFGTDATWLSDLPFDDVYGPDCAMDGPGCEPCCTPTTTQRDCMRVVGDDSRCRPWGTVFRPEREAGSVAAATALQRYASQVVRDGWTDQNHVFLDQDLLAWMVGEGEWPWAGDWLYDQLKPLIGGHWSGGAWLLPGAAWMSHCGELCENGDCAPPGLWDPENEFLMEQFRWYVAELAGRYSGDIPFYEIVNEPNAEFWLCGCSTNGQYDKSVCLENEACAGPNLPVCWTGGPYSQEFVDAYGELLLQTAEVATEEIEAADPEAMVIAIETDVPNPGQQGLSAVARFFMERGFFAAHPGAVLGVHSYPQVDVGLWLDGLTCAYEGAYNYDLPEGCETAPPLEGTFRPRRDAEPRPVRDLWIAQDRATDLSELLADVRDLEAAGAPVSLDDLRMFDTEIHSGWHETWGGAPSALTSRAREAMAALRIGAIMAHQGFVGIEFTNGPVEADDFNLLAMHLSGTRPVWRWDAQRIIEDEAAYDGAVYKLFTRGNEDVIAVWSNGEAPVDLAFELEPGESCFAHASATTIQATDAGAIEVAVWRDDAPPAELRVDPLRQFHFLSVVSDRPAFGWLAGISVPRP